MTLHVPVAATPPHRVIPRSTPGRQAKAHSPEASAAEDAVPVADRRPDALTKRAVDHCAVPVAEG